MSFGGEVGSARYRLTLDETELRSGLQQAEQQARQSSQQIASALDNVSGASSRTGTSFAGLSRSALELFGIGSGIAIAERALDMLGEGLKAVSEATRDAQQAQLQLNAVYRDSARDIGTFADNLASGIGRSNTEARESVATFATLARNYGFTEDQIKTLTQRTADLAAVSGLSMRDAAERVQSAMRGEGEAAERLGLTLNSNAVQAMAKMTDEQRKNYQSMDQVTQAGIIYNEFLRQSSFAQGEAAERINTAAGANDKLNASMNNLATAIGNVVSGGGQLQRMLSGFIDQVTEAVKGIEGLQRALSQGTAPDRQLSDPTRRTITAQGLAPAGVSSGLVTQEGVPAAPAAGGQTIDTLGQAARDQAARAEQLRQNKALEKELEDGIKARGQAEKAEADRAIESLRQQQQEAQRSYQGQLEAYNTFKDERIRMNDATHKVALDNLQAEETAAKEASDAAIKDAEYERDGRSRANEAAHKNALDTIQTERQAAQEASRQRVQDLEIARDDELKAINDRKQAAVDALQAEQDATRQARQQQDRDLEDARRTEDRTSQEAHAAELDGIKQTHEAAVEGYRDRKDAIESTKQAALDALQVETEKESQQHEQALQHIQAEQQAAQAQHDSANRALEDQARSLKQQHDAALAAIRDQEQAAQDAHDQRLRQLQDEQQAEERASQARQDALKAENDEVQRQHQARMDAITAEADAQKRALQDQTRALDEAAARQAFAARIAPLQQNVEQAQTGVQIAREISQVTGDPNTVLAAQRALAQAQQALQKANQDEQARLQKAGIQEQIQSLQDQVDAKKKAENDQYQAERDRIAAEIANEQRRLQVVKDSIAQQIQAQNDQLAALRRNLQQQQEVLNAAYQQRVEQMNAEKRANDDRLAAALANLTRERDAENQRQRDFTANQATRRRDVEATAKTQLDQLQGESEAEAKAYAASTAVVNTRYTNEQQKIADTRRAQDRAIADNRGAEDRDFGARRKAVDDTATHDRNAITDLYNNEKTGLIQVEKNAEHETEVNLDARKLKADTTYNAEKEQIRQTYDDEKTGLIPKLQHSWDEQKRLYDLRKGDIDATYEKEKNQIRLTFDAKDGDPSTWGLIPQLQRAYDETKQKLEDQIQFWTTWKEKSSAEIQTVIDQLDKVIERINKINKVGDTQVREGPQPQEGEGNQGGETSEQAAERRAQEAGGRGLFGGSPLSVAQFGPGSSALRTEFGNTTVDAACGPIAIEALARLAGNPQEFRDILAYAQSHGLWNASQGITGNWGALAEHFGVSTHVTGDQRAAINSIAQGHPVVINTAQHYALAQGYDPATGQFDLGYTGETVYGQRYMTLDQLATRGGGFRNFFVADDLNVFAAGHAAASPSTTQHLSIPSLGVNFDIAAPTGQSRAPTVPASTASGPLVDLARRDAIAAGIDPDIFVRQINQESGFRPDARSPAGASGIAQFMPGTAQGLGVDPFDAPAALAAAAKLMATYVDQYHGNYQLALAAYNAGPGNVAQYGGVPPFAETQSYVHNILGYAAGGIIPEPTALVSLRNFRPYAIAGEVGPERVASLNEASRAAVTEHYNPVHNWYGVTPESVVREMQSALRRERLLRGR